VSGTTVVLDVVLGPTANADAHADAHTHRNADAHPTETPTETPTPTQTDTAHRTRRRRRHRPPLRAARCHRIPAPAASARDRCSSRRLSPARKSSSRVLGGPYTGASRDFGNPYSGSTIIHLCVTTAPAPGGTVGVDRAGSSLCSGGSTVCWTPIRRIPGYGYRYNDTDDAESGVSHILLKGGSAGTSKILVKAKGPIRRYPAGVTAALTSTTSVTLQLRPHDAPAPSCFSITLSDIRKQRPRPLQSEVRPERRKEDQTCSFC